MYLKKLLSREARILWEALNDSSNWTMSDSKYRISYKHNDFSLWVANGLLFLKVENLESYEFSFKDKFILWYFRINPLIKHIKRLERNEKVCDHFSRLFQNIPKK